jgi:hypothetical protein
MTESTKIFLTYNVGGKLAKMGKYTSAKVNSKGEVTSPSRIVEPSEYCKCTIQVTLNEEFYDNAIERPTCPHKRGSGEYHRWLRSPMGLLSLGWNKLSAEQQVQRQVELYVADMTNNPNPINGQDYSFKLI